MSGLPDWVTQPVYGAEFFRNRRAERAAKRARRETRLKEIFGEDNVRSNFLLFDPFADFYLTEQDISPVNRTRTPIVRFKQSVNRSNVKTRLRTVGSTPLYAVAIGVNAHRKYSKAPSLTTSNGSLTSQTRLKGLIKDTTKRTRPIGVDQGEAEMFLPEIHSPSRSVTWVESETLSAGEDLWGPFLDTTKDVATSFNRGVGATYSQGSLDTLRALEQSRAPVLLNQYTEQLYSDALPNSRRFSTIREIAELKDLPGLIKQGFEIFLSKGASGTPTQAMSDLFLAKEFGIDPIISSVHKLVQLPMKIAKRVNYLMAREGKPTSLHAYRNLREPLESAPGFTYSPLISETIAGTYTTAFRDVELKSTINCLVKFPPLEVPSLKEDLVQRLWGARFRVEDLYNLMPWTWLIDWFSGLGDYMDTFCTINENPSTINYGFMTYVSEGHLTTTCLGTVPWSTSRKVTTTSPIISESGVVPTVHSSVLRYKYYLRKDIAELRDVKLNWNPDTLSDFQLSILQALYFQRGKR